MLTYIAALVCGVLIIGFDQITKYIVTVNMELGDYSEFLSGVIEFYYKHNTGGAWSILSDHPWVLLALTVIAMIICIVLLVKSGTKNKLLFWALTLVISGGMGNLIDRIFRDGKVVDFLHFEFWPQFPVFNVADIAVVIGAGLLILYFVIDTINDYKRKKSPAKADNDEQD